MRSATFATLLATVGVALAASVDVKRAPIDVETRQAPAFAFEACTDANWGGACANFPTVLDPLCQNFNPLFNDSITSFRPISGHHFCLLFVDSNCQGANIADSDLPPYNDLAAVKGGFFNNALSSYRCWAT